MDKEGVNVKKLGDFNWIEIYEKLRFMLRWDYCGTNPPPLLWYYVAGLRACDLIYYHDNDSIFLKDAVEISRICEKYITMLLRGKRTSREPFYCWFKKITKKIIRRLKFEIKKLERMSFTSFIYVSHYLTHCQFAFSALYEATKDEKYSKLCGCFNSINPKESLLCYLRTLTEMMEKEIKGGGK